ncbi:MAG: ankyrin repeat domain-containing protein [Firmicutes bacterium]|nr:ankyrin repeat domain-containing protein [Bacillota bacterium]
MFYDVEKTMKAVEEKPSLIFELIKEGHIELVDRLLKKKIVDINTCDENSNSILMRLLRRGDYDIVLSNMSNKDWNVNHQNQDGNTFAHYLVSINYVNVIEIIKKLKKNKDFLPNIKNNKGETILDKSINDNYIYTTVKILEDSRFNNIDIVSFKNLYDTYIKSDKYGKYSKLTNLEIIIDSLNDKTLLPSMERLILVIKNNYETIKEEVLNTQNSICMDTIINNVLKESNI